MTDRINYLTVVLEKDMRDDDAEPIINALKMVKGVISVEPNIVTPDSWFAEERANHDLKMKIYNCFKKDLL